MGLRLVYSICGLSKSKHCGQRSNKFCLGAVKALQAALLSFSRSISLSLSLSLSFCLVRCYCCCCCYCSSQDSNKKRGESKVNRALRAHFPHPLSPPTASIPLSAPFTPVSSKLTVGGAAVDSNRGLRRVDNSLTGCLVASSPGSDNSINSNLNSRCAVNMCIAALLAMAA